MSSHPTSTQTPTDDTAHYRDVLNTLIDQGAALATRIHAHATAATTPDSAVPDATIAFERIARAVRRTIALAQHIAANQALHRPSQASSAHARAQLIRGVEDAIHVKTHLDRHTDADSLYAELAERLEDPELEFDLQGRPTDEVIEEICRDLGVAKQGRSYIWRRRTPKDIASLRQRAENSPGQAAVLQLIECNKLKPDIPPA